MSASTSNGWPYALSTDNVADWPGVSQALAAFADSHVPFAICVGSTSLSVGSAASYTKAVNFPAGLFTQLPMIVVTKSASAGVNTNKWIVSHQSPATTGFTVVAATGDGSTGGGVTTISVYFVAVQWSSTSGSTPGVTLVAQDVDFSQEADPNAMRAMLAEIAAADAELMAIPVSTLYESAEP